MHKIARFMVQRRAHVPLYLFAGIAFLLALSCPAGEPAPAPKTDLLELPKTAKTDGIPGDIDWDAVRQYPVEDKRAFVLSGSAWVRYQGIKLEADHIVFFRHTREVYAEGSIRLRMGESEISAQTGYLDFANDVGYLIDATVRVSAPADSKAPLEAKSKAAKREQKREELRHLDERRSVGNVLRSRDPFGVYLDRADDPQARTNLIFRASKVVKLSRMHFMAEDAFITSDDLVHPLYGVKAGQIDFFMKEVTDPQRPGKAQLKPSRVVAKRGRLQILGLALFPFPTITYDLMQRHAYYVIHPGSSDRWGPYALFRFGYGLGSDEAKLFDPTHIYIDLDERTRRGPGAGFELTWQSGRRPAECDEKQSRFDRGQGHFQVYAVDELQTPHSDDVRRARRDLERRIQPKFDGQHRRQFDPNLLFIARRRADDAAPPSFELDLHEDEFRGMVDFAQHQPLKRLMGIDNLQLDLKYQRQSDRDFMLEYFQNNYLTNNQSEALASLRKPGDNYSAELLYRRNPEDFDSTPPRSPVDYGTFTGYEPALTYSLTPTPLRYGVLASGEIQGARMTRDFERAIYNQDSFDTGRLYSNLDLARPFRLGALNVIPHVGGQAAGYTDSRDGGSIVQGALTYGLDLTTRIYGTFPDLENDALGLTGMRHILEPRISYRGISNTLEDPVDVLDFDAIDDLQRVDRITLALDQTFQTRRQTDEGISTFNFAGFDISLDYYPNGTDRRRLLGGDAFDLLRLDGFIRVLDILKIDAGMGVNLEEGEIETAAVGFTIDPQTRWRLRFEERFNFHDRDRRIVGSDQVSFKFEYQLSERWSSSLEYIYEKNRTALQRKGRQLERISVTRSYGSMDATFTYSVDRNLDDRTFFFTLRPVMAYRNLIVPSQDLLVAQGEVGEEIDAPEERNFDPFELLKRRKVKGGDTKVRSRSMPPPPPLPRDNEQLPAPPAPKPDQRAGLFEDPYKKPKIDGDDWTTPPPTPASTREP